MTDMKQIDLEKLKKHYFDEKLSAKKTGELLRISESFVNKQIKLLGLKKRTNAEGNRRFSNIEAFKNIDTQEKAYWLGYLFADGCVVNSQHTVKGKKYSQTHISLTSIDKEIIESFKKFMGCDTETKSRTLKISMSSKECVYYTANMSSLELFKDLRDKGMTENKTYNLKPPKNIPEQLIKDFIRGFFDGDGSVYISKRLNPHKNPYKKQKYYKTLNSQIMGSREFCEFVRKELSFLTQDKGIYKENRIEHNDIYYLRMSGRLSEKFYQYIYTGATVYLKRKKDKFDNFFKEKGSTTIIGGS